MSTKKHQFGFTLVEVLVALTIGLFLTAGMFQMYSANRQTVRFSDALSRIQENGRYALALIARDMRMADFWGCSRGNNLAVHLNPGCLTPDVASTNAMAGTDGAPGAPDGVDSITLRGAVGTGLIVDPSTTTTDLYVEGTVAPTVLEANDIALVSDCRGGDLFQVTGLSGDEPNGPTLVGNVTGAAGTPGNATDTRSNVYDQTAAVHRWREVIYSIRPIRPGENEANALFIQEDACTGGAAREVVEGVENMQIAYGEDVIPPDGDGTADRYVAASSVTNWDRVVSVRINLLLASAEDNLVDRRQQVTFNDYDGADDDTFTADDRRIYQVVTATFAVRNRSL